ncbi:hypothetical protein J4474_03055 [Candidatus Pacearchaeota archaeon]|nr:hypothetical protein [Candidatus Pacearchaeota archaeon]
MAKVFYLGQIKEEHRGDLTAVVTEDKDNGELGTMCYETLSEEIIRATGTMTVKYPSLRVYIGISQKISEEIASLTCGRKKEDFNFRKTLDSLVVIPYFLKQDSQEKPEK